MLNEIDKLLVELASDKVQERQKAFGKLGDILNGRLSELQNLIEQNEDVSWGNLFKSAHKGIMSHSQKLSKTNTELNENDAKIKNYSRVILNLCDSPANESSGICYNLLMSSVSEVMKDDAGFQYFGKCYLQILQMCILKPSNNLTTIKLDSWTDMLEILFLLLKSKRHNLPFANIVTSTQRLIQLGCSFSHLSLNLRQYLPVLTSLLEKENRTKQENQDLLIVAYNCCRNIVVDSRFEVCRFTEAIAKHIHYVYKVDLNDETKESLFRLMDLSIVVHHPNLATNRKELEYIEDKVVWHTQLRNYWHIVQEELKLPLKTKFQNQARYEVNQVFAQFAARLCYLIHWDDAIWEDVDIEEASTSKRMKRPNKLQLIMQFAQSERSEFNWKWLIVISEIVYNYPSALEHQDFQQMLQMLSDCQANIDHASHIYAFTKCCYVLLQNDVEFNAAANTIIANICRELWHKIADGSARVCTSSNKHSIESHILLQTLIYHQKYPSSSFIEDVIKIFITHSTIKCDATLQTLIFVLKTFNLDSLPIKEKLSEKILNYVFEKLTLTDLKKVITTSGMEKPSAKVLSHIGVICCLSKTDVVNHEKCEPFDRDKFFESNWKLQPQVSYKKEITEIIHYILLKANERLLVEDEDFLRIQELDFHDGEQKSEYPVEIKCILDQTMFEQLQKLTEFKTKIIDEDKNIDEIKEYLQHVMENNEIMLHLADNFLYFEAFNEEKLEGCFIAKKIDFHMQEIERLFSLIIQKSEGLDMKETHQLLMLVKSLFSSEYHRKICLRIRTFKLDNCIRWVSRQVNHKFRTYDEDSEERRIGLNEFLTAKMEERLKFLAIETFLMYNNFEGVNTDTFEQRVANINLICDDNMDLHAVFHILKLLRKQESVSENVSGWIWTFIMEICRDYHTHQYVSNCIIDSLQDIVHISKKYPSLTSNVVQIYMSFGSICVRPEYNPMTTVTFLQQFKYFHQEYFPRVIDEEPVKKMYLFVIEQFLSSNLFVIKMAAIKTVGYLLYSDIEQIQEDKSLLKLARKSRSNIFKNILNSHSINYVGIEMETNEENDDTEANDLAGNLQLFTTIFCVNFVMRKPIILEISKLMLRYKLTEVAALKVFNKILNFLKCDAQSLMDNNTLIHLLSQWIIMGLKLEEFPWHFSGSPSYRNFVEENYFLIFLALMKNKCNQVDAFARHVELIPKKVIEELFPECFAFMLPIEARCKVSETIVKNAEQMKKKLDSLFPSNELKSALLRKVSHVIGHLLSTVFDNDKFQEICGFPLETYSSVDIIDCANFDKCLNHLKTHFSMPSNQSILTFFCRERRFQHFIEKMLMIQKKRVQTTVLKEHKLLYLLQYCILVENLFNYLDDPSITPERSVKGFIVREITNFLCILLMDKRFGMKVRETASTFLSTFLKKILPICASDIAPFLNKTLSSLVTICKNVKSTGMSPLELKCFTMIKFLVFEQQAVLEEKIANLDTFPDEPVFKDLKQKQLEIKYKNGNFSLIQEIKHFLSVKKRKIEGLIALRMQLAEKKSELKSLFDDLLPTLGFSEDGEMSLLHKLVRSLIGYARSINEEERAVEAVKCLGEIGNYNLFTMVFITENHQNETVYEKIESFSHCQKIIRSIALEQMETMVLHENPRIFESASAACYTMIETVSESSKSDNDLCVYLRPFDTNTISVRNLFYEQPKEGKELDLVMVMKDDEYSTYKTWIKRLAGTMIIFAGNKSLEQVSTAQQTFAELMNPMMMQLLLFYNDSSVNERIIAGINFFFDESCEKLNYPKVNEGSIFLNKLAIRQMLKLVECIRIHCQEHPKTNMTQKMQELNCLNIAKAAKHCEAFFTAVLYCEMWAEKRLKMESVTFETSINHKTLQEIMYDAFTAIGIHDPSYLFVSPLTKRSLYLQISNQNWQNLLEHDTAYNESQSDTYVKLLNDMGLHVLTNKLTNSKQKMRSYQYECLWRLCYWDILIETDSQTKDQKAVIDSREEFEKYHYSGLKCLKNGDELGMKIAVSKARKSILQMLKEESLECTKNLYKFLGMSQLLQQIEDFAEIRFNRSQDSHIKLLYKWKAQDRLPHDFKLIEPILSQRNSIYDTANIKAGKRTWIPQALQSNLLYIVKESIDATCYQDAIKTIAKMRALPDLMPLIKAEMLIQEAQLNLKDNMKLAKHCLKRVMEEKEFEREFMCTSIAYRLYGEIQAENHADEIKKITQDFFQPSIFRLEKYAKSNKKSHLVVDVDYSQPSQDTSQPIPNDDEDVVVQQIKDNICVFDIVARYYDREYISLCDYVISPEYVNKLEAIEKNEKKMKGFKALYSKDKTNRDAMKSYTILIKSIEIDKNEVQGAERQMKVAAKMAMFHYLRGAINDSSDNVLSIFRIISIWLANSKSPVMQKMLNESIEKIPSYKFLVALPQLIVRLNEKDNDNSNGLLQNLLERCGLHHPHHTLPLILSLVNSYTDSSNASSSQEEPRVIGARKIWSKLSMNKKLSSTINQMERMTKALIDLANKSVDVMPKNHSVLLLNHLADVQCPTLELPVMKDAHYSSVTSVIKWIPSFSKVGGINAPKKIYCLCSDGVLRPQLLKGSDDMRQDAVMQQVFGVVNQLLKSNKDTSSRHARIRTYKVVPFSRRSGILEWCENTMPIGTYLVGNKEVKGAHERFNPTDWKPIECLHELAKNDTADFQTKEDAFIKVCSNIQPVFHHFFYEKFKNPGKWFERRLAYTTSAAVSSIVGYILGIGDRHVQNILIDCNTAEVIHIDFGIAFEQGKILPHKELVPFRLTRDITAPMGVCGVEGIFRRTCEKTLGILRQNEKTLTTILEVLLYDPMYAWTLSTSQAQRHQLNEEYDYDQTDETNQDQRDSMASRALLRVQAKLKGQADDTTGYSSVEGQVEYLIQTAMNTSLLSRLFKGWQAYL